jgi:hypothetical protein
MPELSAASRALSSPTPLDALLEQVCVALQITDTQYNRAKQSYEAIGDWLAAPESPLSALRPTIYPQGSAATQTTVRPRSHEEYDLDLVCQVHAAVADPMRLYDMVYARLDAHSTYAPLLEKKNRCIRVDYKGNFHLDILPARPDPRGSQEWCVLVPDRGLAGWKESNPLGYARWFSEQARRVTSRVRASTMPLPLNDEAHELPPLNRAVQLLKRRRDMVFEGHDHAPRSIVLATLSGEHYGGEISLVETLDRGLTRIEELARRTQGILEVHNPTNHAENFSEAWDEVSYAKFLRFVRTFRVELAELTTVTGLPALTDRLSTLFGAPIATKAVEAYTRSLETARSSGTLRFLTGGGLTTVVGSGTGYPKNTFFGGE